MEIVMRVKLDGIETIVLANMISWKRVVAMYPKSAWYIPVRFFVKIAFSFVYHSLLFGRILLSPHCGVDPLLPLLLLLHAGLPLVSPDPDSYSAVDTGAPASASAAVAAPVAPVVGKDGRVGVRVGAAGSVAPEMFLLNLGLCSRQD